jgi:hypothetical protein
MDRLGIRQYWPNRTRLTGILLVALMLPGCAAPPKATVHAQDTLLGRQLYDSEPAFIYASSQAAADEVGTDLATAIRDYRKATGHAPAGKGLLVVTDKNDQPYADRQTVLRMGKHFDDTQAFRSPTTMPANAGEALAKAEKEVGWETMEKLFLTKVGTIDMAEAVRQWDLVGCRAAGARWVLTVPTSDLAQQAVHGMMQKAMSQQDVSLAKKVLIAPLLPLLEAKVRQAAVADRQIGVYLMLAMDDPVLDAAAMKATFQAYQKRKGDAVTQEMPMPAGVTKPGSASQSAGATPSTRSSE